MIDGRNVEGFAAHHFGDGRVVHVGGVFERIDSGPYGIAGSVRTVRMDRDTFAKRMCGIHRGLHLLEREGLEAGDIASGSG